MADRGKFIVVEGIDGSGKSSACRYIKELLSESCECFSTAEPRDIGMGMEIREILHGERSRPPDMIMAAMFAIDRYHHTKRILERLEAGVTVICDRYIWSTYAYQVASHDLNSAFVVKKLHEEFYLPPDLVIYMEVKPMIALQRMATRTDQAVSVFDNLAQVAKAYGAYMEFMYVQRLGFGPDTKLEIVYADAEWPDVQIRLHNALYNRGYINR